jgi:hypothetical protein
MPLILTNKRVRWGDVYRERLPSAILDGHKLYHVTAQSEEPEYLGSRQRTIESQLRSTHGRRSWARRFSLECSTQHYDDTRALASLLERKAGSRVRLWLSAWPERQRVEHTLASSPLVLSIDNAGPMVWPALMLQALDQVTTFKLTWRSWNLLLNSGAELGEATPNNWTEVETPGWERWMVHDGWRSLSGTNTAYWYQTVPVEAGIRYAASAMIATTTDGTHSELLKVDWLDAGDSVISSDSAAPQNLVPDFRHVFHIAEAPVGAVQARIRLTTDQIQPAVYDNVFFGPVGTEDTAPPPYQEGELMTWEIATGLPIASGGTLQLSMFDRLALIDGDELGVAESTQWFGLPSGWQTLVIEATGDPTLDARLMLTLDWSVLCEVLSMSEESQAFMSPQGWENHGRKVSVELEEI